MDEKVKRINADTFVISKITDGMESIKQSIVNIEDSRKQTLKMIDDKKYPRTDTDVQLGERRIPLHYLSKENGGKEKTSGFDTDHDDRQTRGDPDYQIQ